MSKLKNHKGKFSHNRAEKVKQAWGNSLPYHSEQDNKWYAVKTDGLKKSGDFICCQNAFAFMTKKGKLITEIWREK